jgi:hypothetical protein
VSALRFWLTQELAGKSAEIFCDTDSIEVGDRWPDALRSALRASRCMVSIWSPSYFRSEWCVSEWQSFLTRERMLNIGHHGLIAPVRFHDGQHFPALAQNVQWVDFEPYTSTFDSFWESSRAVEFEDRIKVLARSVAAIISRTPEFAPDWPLVDGSPEPSRRVGLRRL